MAETFGADYLYGIISTDVDVVSLVGTAVYTSRMVPETETSTETINLYLVTPKPGGDTVESYVWSCDCRSATEAGAYNIALAVDDALNRHNDDAGGKMYFSICEITGAIPPVDDTDVYNVPVNITLRRR